MANIVQFPDRGARMLALLQAASQNFTTGFMTERERQQELLRQQAENEALGQALGELSRLRAAEPGFNAIQTSDQGGFTGPELTGAPGVVPPKPAGFTPADMSALYKGLGIEGTRVFTDLLGKVRPELVGGETPAAVAARSQAAKLEEIRTTGEQAKGVAETQVKGQIDVATINRDADLLRTQKVIDAEAARQNTALAAQSEKDYNDDPFVYLSETTGEMAEIPYASRNAFSDLTQIATHRSTFKTMMESKEALARIREATARGDYTSKLMDKIEDELTKNETWVIFKNADDPAQSKPIDKGTGPRDKFLAAHPNSFALSYDNWLETKKLAIAATEARARMKASQAAADDGAYLRGILKKEPATWTPSERWSVFVLGRVAASPEAVAYLQSQLNAMQDPLQAREFVRSIAEVQEAIVRGDEKYLGSIVDPLVATINAADVKDKPALIRQFNALMVTAAPNTPALWTYYGAVPFKAAPPRGMKFEAIEEAGKAVAEAQRQQYIDIEGRKLGIIRNKWTEFIPPSGGT